jgi:serine protease
MVDNKVGGVGIAPRAKARVISQWDTNGQGRWDADVIIDAIANMSFGDILLLEAQTKNPMNNTNYMPVETIDSTFDAIRLATALGITVVEAGGNGYYDLDTYVHTNGLKIFNRSVPNEFRDSGAIMVGASGSNVPHSKSIFSNHGSRIDVYAWGENIDTAGTNFTGTDHTAYDPFFGGTSGASPIITGCSIVVQGIAQANMGFKLSPLQVREMVKMGGTPSNDPPVDKIGVMPNLRAIIDGLDINVAPDVYLRDYIGDVGNPTTGLLSSSPDIIVRQQPIADPDGMLGQGSGNEYNASLSDEVVQGRDHSIYVRLLNRGGSPATDTAVKVYWSPPSTLVTPQSWTPIGTVTQPAVATNRILTVSPRLAWPAGSVPLTGHYCFIAVAGAEGDPEPILPNSFPDWVRFVGSNNNVAWRNFNVISSPSFSDGGQIIAHRFPFNIPGAFDDDRKFAITTDGSLPRGSTASLLMPWDLTRQLGIVLRDGGEKKSERAAIPLHVFGRSKIGEGILPAKTFAECELRVLVPEETYKLQGVYEFAVIQTWEGIEVGRLTYHFGQVAILDKPEERCDHCHCVCSG